MPKKHSKSEHIQSIYCRFLWNVCQIATFFQQQKNRKRRFSRSTQGFMSKHAKEDRDEAIKTRKWFKRISYRKIERGEIEKQTKRDADKDRVG